MHCIQHPCVPWQQMACWAAAHTGTHRHAHTIPQQIASTQIMKQSDLFLYFCLSHIIQISLFQGSFSPRVCLSLYYFLSFFIIVSWLLVIACHLFRFRCSLQCCYSDFMLMLGKAKSQEQSLLTGVLVVKHVLSVREAKTVAIFSQWCDSVAIMNKFNLNRTGSYLHDCMLFSVLISSATHADLVLPVSLYMQLAETTREENHLGKEGRIMGRERREYPTPRVTFPSTQAHPKPHRRQA